MIGEAAALLKAAKHPVILMGRVSRSLDGWNERIALAETLNAKVVSDLKIGCGFPTDHPLHAGAPASNAMVPEAIEAIKAADVILALDWVDLGGGLRNALGQETPKAKIINVSPTSTSTTAGAWTTKSCRRSTSSSPRRPTRRCRCCWPRSAVRRAQAGGGEDQGGDVHTLAGPLRVG